MKTSVLLSLFCIIHIFANAQDPKTFFTTDYTSLTVPVLFNNDLSYMDTVTLTTSYKKIDDLKHNRSLLPSLSAAVSAVTIFKEEASGELKIAGQNASLSKTNYVVIYDFTQTQQLQIVQKDGSVISGLIGISVRMTARIHTKKKGINLANLFGIGLAAQQEKLTGSLEIKVFGMSSQKINELIPVTADLSPSAIQNCLTSVATIKSHIYDEETRITPYWLAFNVTGNDDSSATKKPAIDFKSIADQIRKYAPSKSVQ